MCCCPFVRILSTLKLIICNVQLLTTSWLPQPRLWDYSQSLGLHADPTSPSSKKSVLNGHWKDWCWRWNSNPLATWCKEWTHWKRPWCWERLKAGEGGDRRWDGWMALLTQWIWVWVSSRSWWWTRKPGLQQSMGSQRVRHDWTTELNLMLILSCLFYCNNIL